MTDVHIASFIVYTKPFAQAYVCAAMQSWPGIEIVEKDNNGKMVLTHESDKGMDMSALMDKLHGLQGVVHTTLVSHFIASEDELNEVIA